jgi:hypothetical protein
MDRGTILVTKQCIHREAAVRLISSVSSNFPTSLCTMRDPHIARPGARRGLWGGRINVLHFLLLAPGILSHYLVSYSRFRFPFLYKSSTKAPSILLPGSSRNNNNLLRIFCTPKPIMGLIIQFVRLS